VSKKIIQQIKDWLKNNVDDPDETPEGLSEDSVNLLNKIEEWEEEDNERIHNKSKWNLYFRR